MQFSSLPLFALGAAAATTLCSVTNRDNCLRAVVASSHAPGPASALADCSSFFRYTQTPCAVTQTSTTTSSPIVSATATSTFTASTTVASTVSATATVISTVTLTETTTVSSSSTVTTISYPVALTSIAVNKRTVTACSVVASPSSVPTYASACSGTARYSSACACNGVTQTTVTASAPTTVISKTVTLSPVTITVFTVTVSTTLTQTTPTTITSATLTLTNTVTTGTTTTTSVTSTQTVVGLPVGFTEKYESTNSPSCFYNAPTEGFATVSGDSTDNYILGRTQCASACAADFNCKAFQFAYITSPYGGQPQIICYLYPAPFDSSKIECGYGSTTVFQADYDKN